MNHVILRSLIILLLLCSIIVPTRAQTESPWPPKATDIFVAGIEILDFEMLDKVEQSPLGEITIIPEARVIKGADGRIYPWPDTMAYFQLTAAPPIVIYDELYLYEKKGEGGDIDATWRLNLKTGIFVKYTDTEPPDTPCGKVWPHLMSWDLYHLNNENYLCNQNTAQKLPFPGVSSLLYLNDTYPVVEELSDGRLFVAAKTQNPSEISIFVQSQTNKQFMVVGTLPLKAHIEVETERDNIILLTVRAAYANNGQPEDVAYGIFNPANNTFTNYTPSVIDPLNTSQWSFWPNPNIAMLKQSSDSTCMWIIYDLVTNQELALPYGTLCFPEFSRSDGTSYFRLVAPDKKSATILRYNALTKERREIYTGEIESIVWASDDDRYLMVIADNSGEIDTMPAQFTKSRASGSPSLKLIDLRDQSVGFETPAFVGQMRIGWMPYISPIAPNWIMLHDTEQGKNLLINSSPAGIIIRNVSIINRINDEWATYTENSIFGLYHLNNERKIPIFKRMLPENYVINTLTPLDNERFSVMVSYSNKSAAAPADLEVAAFTIKIPDVNLPLMKNILAYPITSQEGAY